MNRGHACSRPPVQGSQDCPLIRPDDKFDLSVAEAALAPAAQLPLQHLMQL